MTMHPVSAGFIPLVDAAPLIVAVEKGFAEQHSIALKLKRSKSWAGLRDRLSVGDVNAAHMLAPVVVASQLNVGNPKAPMVTPCGLSMNGNAISVSTSLFDAMQATGWKPSRDPASGAQAVARLVKERKRAGEEPLTFASVYPFSSHSYELRYWLASAGIDPDEDVNLTIVPPPMIVAALGEGHIDGFCVGAPWSGLGAESGLSHIVAFKADLWPQGPEKVLALREEWADDQPQTVSRLVRMLIDAARWCSEPAHRDELAQILSGDEYLDMAVATIAAALAGRPPSDGAAEVEDHLLFDPKVASYPWRAHALWFYAQMVRWGQVRHTETNVLLAKKAYRPDFYRAALASALATPASQQDEIRSGELPSLVDSSAAEVRLFDGRLFDPDDLDGYFAELGAASR